MRPPGSRAVYEAVIAINTERTTSAKSWVPEKAIDSPPTLCKFGSVSCALSDLSRLRITCDQNVRINPEATKHNAQSGTGKGSRAEQTRGSHERLDRERDRASRGEKAEPIREAADGSRNPACDAPVGRSGASARRQHHDHLPAFELGFLLHLGERGGVALDALKQLNAELLVGHFTTAEPQGHLDLVAFLEEASHRTHLHVVIVVVDHRPDFDLLDLDDLLLLACLGGLFLCLIFVLAEVENLGDGGCRIGRDLDQVESRLLRQGDGGLDFSDASVGAVLIDQLNLADADLLVHARAVFLDGLLRGFHRATNGE